MKQLSKLYLSIFFLKYLMMNKKTINQKENKKENEKETEEMVTYIRLLQNLLF